MTKLLRVLYLSRANEVMDEDAVRDLLDISRSNNEKLEITGVLCAGRKDFIQVLEGPEPEVIRLYAKILDDPRHTDCTLLSISPVEARMFDKWSMAYIKNDETRDTGCQLLQSYRMNVDSRNEIVAILQRFLKLVEAN